MKNLRIFIISIILLFSSNIYVYADSKIDCNNTLKKGSTGSNVINLQKKLNNTINCNLETDGIFGKLTKACVIKFQEKYNLETDGIVGKKTCSKLNSLTLDKSKYIIITINELNIRESNSINSNIIGNAKLGEILKIYGTKKGSNRTWYKIKTNNTYGYVSNKYAKKNAIILDISKQELLLYKNGKIILDTNVVTGNKGNHDTPVGHYLVKESNKTTDRTLRGTNDNGSKYAAHVDYWMPFITERAIGFHDASWRSTSEFNNNTYKTNGSHGCVNMMHNDAKILYDNIRGNIDVIVK